MSFPSNFSAGPGHNWKNYYCDPTKDKTYLEQLGIDYPTVGTTPAESTPSNDGRR
jgi:hypothetical protein